MCALWLQMSTIQRDIGSQAIIHTIGPVGASGVIEVGTGVHSGRSGPESKTAGCIRTCTDAMRVINKVAKSDPVHTVTVENNGPNVRQWQQQLETAKAAETAAARKRKRDGAQ